MRATARFVLGFVFWSFAATISGARSAAAPASSGDSVAVATPAVAKESPVDDWRLQVLLDVHSGRVSCDGLAASLAPVGGGALQVAIDRTRAFAERSDLIVRDGYGADVGYFDSDLAWQTAAANNVGTRLWRYGTASARGYGYTFGTSGTSLVFSKSSSIAGYDLDVDDDAWVYLAPADSVIVSRFATETRFGEAWSADVRYWLQRSIGVRVGYERAVVFPGFKFGYWFTAGLVYGLVEWGLEEVLVAAAEGAPGCVPVVNFVLQSALGYAYYELRQEKMNWPFDTEAPLGLDTFKLGLSCRF